MGTAAKRSRSHAAPPFLELELIQSHMTQKPLLRGEVGARALRVRCACAARASQIAFPMGSSSSKPTGLRHFLVNFGKDKAT